MLPKGFLELARKLIATDTVSARGTRQAADLLQALWGHAGLTVRRQVVEDVHVNLLGGPGANATGPGGVLLVTHLDTVPPGPVEKWQSDPWTLTERDGFLYGLGSADVKLDALCKAEAARRLQGRKGQRPFWLLGTFGEEVGLRGARHFTERSEEHTSELQSLRHLVCRLLLEKKTNTIKRQHPLTPHSDIGLPLSENAANCHRRPLPQVPGRGVLIEAPTAEYHSTFAVVCHTS